MPILAFDPNTVTYTSQAIATLTIPIIIAIAVGLAFIPANIAAKKGYSKGGFWIFGFFLFLPALIVSLCLNESNNNGSSSADELLKYKTLLDQGIISRSEFEAKKNQLMK